MPAHVFTYGSLMFPPVWERVVRGHYRSAPAVASDHARYAIRGETYPGMVPGPGQQVAGVLYFDVAPQDLAALDAFEGEAYRRVTLPLRLDSGETVQAETYLYLDIGRLAGAPWEPEAFQMQRFLDTYCRTRQV